MVATADVLAGVVRGRNLVARIQGREHVLVEGWTLLGTPGTPAGTVGGPVQLEAGGGAHPDRVEPRLLLFSSGSGDGIGPSVCNARKPAARAPNRTDKPTFFIETQSDTSTAFVRSAQFSKANPSMAARKPRRKACRIRRA